MSQIAQLRAELRQNEDNLAEVEEILSMVPDEPEASAMKADIQANIANIQVQIAALKPASPPKAETEEKKWNPDDHPAFRKSTGTPAAAEEQKIAPVFKVGDTVSAKYKADKAFYPATIIEITGSATNPMYTVNFKGYSGKEIIRAHDIRPIASVAAAQKRKADGSPVTSAISTPITSNPAAANTGVISAAANINPDLALAARNQASKSVEGQARPDKPAKKVKTNKALEKSKNSWQAWQSKASSGKVGKVANKESMFRTGQSDTARVGFTGSGHEMRKDATRSRHKYDKDLRNED